RARRGRSVGRAASRARGAGAARPSRRCRSGGTRGGERSRGHRARSRRVPAPGRRSGVPPRARPRSRREAEDACEAAEGSVEGGLERTGPAYLRLEMERAHAEYALAAVGLQVGTPDAPVAVEEGG